MYCLDTYVIMSILEGNENYNQDFSNFVIADWTLAELYWVLLRDKNLKTADYWFKKLKPYAINVPLDIIPKALNFRLTNKKKDLSYFDAIGYIFAKENNLIFVTGDKEFKNFKGVKFVK